MLAKIFAKKRPVLAVRPYRYPNTHPWILDLRAYSKDKGRLFFNTKAEADAEKLRQQTLLERHSRDAIGLSQREMSDFITARNKLAEYGANINEAAEFFADHQKRVRRCNVTVKQLAGEVIKAKEHDGHS